MKKINLFILFLVLISFSGCKANNKFINNLYDIIEKYEEKYNNIEEFTYTLNDNNNETIISYNSNKKVFYINDVNNERYEFIKDFNYYIVDVKKETYYEYPLVESKKNNSVNMWNSSIASVYTLLSTFKVIEMEVLYFLETSLKANNSFSLKNVEYESKVKGDLNISFNDYMYQDIMYSIIIEIDNYIISDITLEFEDNKKVISLDTKSDIDIPNLSEYDKLKLYI